MRPTHDATGCDLVNLGPALALMSVAAGLLLVLGSTLGWWA